MIPTVRTRPRVARPLVALVAGVLLLGAAPVATADAKPKKPSKQDVQAFDGFGRKNG